MLGIRIRIRNTAAPPLRVDVSVSSTIVSYSEEALASSMVVLLLLKTYLPQ